MQESNANSLSGPERQDCTLDPDEYLPLMAEFDLTEEQQVEFLKALWSIMRMFVELGLDVKSCGQLTDTFGLASKSDAETINCPVSPACPSAKSDSTDDGSTE